MSEEETNCFNWELTNRELVIFIPNYDRKFHLEYTVPNNGITKVPKDRWIIIVGNDGINNDLSHLEKYNLKYFYIKRKNTKSRNSCFIRNYAIKRCRSRFFFQTDPEIFIHGDFIFNMLKFFKNKENDVYRVGRWLYLSRFSNNIFTQNTSIDPLSLLKNDRKTQAGTIVSHTHSYFHWGYGIKTNTLQSIRGYDEDYKTYGREDRDMFYRLKAKNISNFTDGEITAIHLWHYRGKALTAGSEKMRKIWENKNPKKIIRNPNEWGNG